MLIWVALTLLATPVILYFSPFGKDMFATKNRGSIASRNAPIIPTATGEPAPEHSASNHSTLTPATAQPEAGGGDPQPAAVAVSAKEETMVSQIGDQDIRFSRREDDQAYFRVRYLNKSTGNVCTASLERLSNANNASRYRQYTGPGDRPCRMQPDILISTSPRSIYAEWVDEDGRILMSGDIL